MKKAMTLIFVFLMLLVTADANDEIESAIDDLLVYPIVPKMKIQKRDTATSKRIELKEKNESNYEQFQNLILDKLLQHTKALENLMEKVDSNQNSLKRMIDDFITLEPKMPDNIHFPTASLNHNSENDHPVVEFGKTISKYGVLVKDMIKNDIRQVSEPVALVEYNLSSNLSNAEGAALSLSRRSFDERLGPEFNPPALGVSTWCLVSTLCRKSAVPICGFDDRFGYGKFEDLCHMLKVNCFYKYNFSVVAHCRPFYV